MRTSILHVNARFVARSRGSKRAEKFHEPFKMTKTQEGTRHVSSAFLSRGYDATCRNFPPRDKEEPRPNADNRFESVSATRDASLRHYKAVHQNGSATELGSRGRRRGPFVMPRVEFQRRKATHKRLLAHTRGSPLPPDFFVFY